MKAVWRVARRWNARLNDSLLGDLVGAISLVVLLYRLLFLPLVFG